MMTLLWLLLLALIGLASGAPAGIAPATETAPLAANLTLTIQNRVCPVAYADASYVQDCPDPIANMEFTITAPATHVQTAATDPAGAVTFANLPAGPYEITGGPPGEFVQNAISCHLTGGDRGAVPFFPRDNRAIGLTLGTANVTCDWYSIPEDLRGDG